MILSSEAEGRAPFTTGPPDPDGPDPERSPAALAARYRGWILTAIAGLVLVSLLLSYMARRGGETQDAGDADHVVAEPLSASTSEAPPGSTSTGSTSTVTTGSTTTTTGSTTTTIGSASTGSTTTASQATTTPTTTSTPTTTTAPATTSVGSSTRPTTVSGSTTRPPITTRATTTTTKATTTTRATTTRPPTTALGADLIGNGSFEAPTVAAGYIIGAAPSWSSTAFGQVEIWQSGHEGVTSPSGDQHAELNVDRPATFSQTIGVTAGRTYRWSLWHRGRADTDTLQVIVDGRVVATLSTGQAWRQYSGEVEATTSRLTLALRAVDSGSIGNLIDDVQLRPILVG
jgi:hypothetical protein